jgi:4a-hydroxytetrahydrobiopterin dehydratase
MATLNRTTVVTAEERDALTESVVGWTVTEDYLFRRFEFTDFDAAFRFMTKVAVIAEEIDHHPDWSNSWNKVEIQITNHQAGGLTEIDFVLGSKISELVDK